MLPRKEFYTNIINGGRGGREEREREKAWIHSIGKQIINKRS